MAPLFLVLQELEEMEEDIDEYIEVISEGIQEILGEAIEMPQGTSLRKTMFEIAWIVGSKKTSTSGNETERNCN